MKVSESWLREWVNPAISTDELVAQLTMAGLEVDGIESIAGDFSGVMVGEIIAVEQHPDADKLRVCQVAGLPDFLSMHPTFILAVDTISLFAFVIMNSTINDALFHSATCERILNSSSANNGLR